MEQESWSGQIRQDMRETSEMVAWRGKELSNMLKVIDMLEHLKKTLITDLECGMTQLLRPNSKESGLMEKDKNG